MPGKHLSARKPVDEGLPSDLPPEERRPARIRLVAARRLAGLRVVLDGVHDPHNISAVLRSCDAFGVQHVHLLGKPESLPVNRLITRGCDKWLTFHHHASAAACAEALHAEDFSLWAAMPDRKAAALREIDFGRKVALLFGAERAGLSRDLLAHCDGRYVIPMAGFSESLNISVAAAVSLYAGAHARRAALGAATDLLPDETNALAEQWLAADRARRFRGCTPPLEPPPQT